jgi:putative peptidoglycan lipid II flippase
MLASMAAVAVNLVWCGFTYRSLGVPGLALGTTLGTLVNYVILRVGFGRLVGPAAAKAADPSGVTTGSPGAPEAGRVRMLVALMVSNLTMALVAWACWRIGVWLCAGPDLRLKGALAGGWLALAIGLGFVSYALVLRACRYPGAEELLAMPVRLVDRFRIGDQRP